MVDSTSDSASLGPIQPESLADVEQRVRPPNALEQELNLDHALAEFPSVGPITTDESANSIRERVALLHLSEGLPPPPESRRSQMSDLTTGDLSEASIKPRSAWAVALTFVGGVAVGGLGLYAALPRNAASGERVEVEATTTTPASAASARPSDQLSKPPTVRGVTIPATSQTPRPPPIEWRSPTSSAGETSAFAQGATARPDAGRGDEPASPSELRGTLGEVAVERKLTDRQSKPGAQPLLRSGSGEEARGTAGSPGTGSIWVISNPRGASVFLDERAIGRTPIAIPEVGEGSHALRLELTGHDSWSSSVKVRGGHRERVTVTLTPGTPQ